jgi:hypothetical protein
MKAIEDIPAKDMPKIRSSCCNDKLMVMAGRYSFDPELEPNKIVPRGKTYYYFCMKCEDTCDAI